MTITCGIETESNELDDEDKAGDCVVCGHEVWISAGTETRCGEGWAHDIDCLAEHARNCEWCSDVGNDPAGTLAYRILHTKDYPDYADMDERVLERVEDELGEQNTRDARSLLEALLSTPTIGSRPKVRARAEELLAKLA